VPLTQVKSLPEKEKLLRKTQQQVNELKAKLQAAETEAKPIDSEILLLVRSLVSPP
jgi:hypothetical protein